MTMFPVLLILFRNNTITLSPHDEFCYQIIFWFSFLLRLFCYLSHFHYQASTFANFIYDSIKQNGPKTDLGKIGM